MINSDSIRSYIMKMNEIDLYDFINSVLLSEEIVAQKDVRDIVNFSIATEAWTIRSLVVELIGKYPDYFSCHEILAFAKRETRYDVVVDILYCLYERNDIEVNDLTFFLYSQFPEIRNVIAPRVIFSKSKMDDLPIIRNLIHEVDSVSALCSLNAVVALHSHDLTECNVAVSFLEGVLRNGGGAEREEAKSCLDALAAP